MQKAQKVKDVATMSNGEPRFVVKFNNGYWKAFDTVNYQDEAIFRLKVLAEEAVAGANKYA